MPAIPHGAQPDWVNARFQPQRPQTAFEKIKELLGFHTYDENQFFIAPLRVPPAPKTFEEEIQAGLQHFQPVQTKTGVNGSFFLRDSLGQKSAIFKPMNMEAGGLKNHRLTASQNVQFRKSILPGQGAGNEALAYGLDKFAFGHHYEIPKTVLISLTHPAFEGRELGSAQKFLAGTCTLADLTPKEITDIPKHEWEKLNFRLISGSTDAHYGNILYSKTDRKLYLIDSGDDFVGEEGECQYWNPWAAEERCNQPMSDEESSFLRNLNISKVMEAFEWQAQFNEQASPVLKVSNDKYLTQILRLILAQAAGQNKLSQARWAFVMNPYRDPYGIVHRSPIEHIYDQYIRPYSGQPGNWKDISQMIDWKGVNKAIRAAI